MLRYVFTTLQEVISCNGKGSCQGGSVGDVYGYAKTHGLVEEGCNNYKAINESESTGRCALILLTLTLQNATRSADAEAAGRTTASPSRTTLATT